MGVPTDWASFLAAAKALKKIGVYGYVTAAASSNSAYGTHTLASFMINNGGGMFDEAWECRRLCTTATSRRSNICSN